MKKDPSFFENILGLPPRYDQPCEHFYPFFERLFLFYFLFLHLKNAQLKKKNNLTEQGAILLSSLMINASKEMVFSSFFANSSLWLFKMHNVCLFFLSPHFPCLPFSPLSLFFFFVHIYFSREANNNFFGKNGKKVTIISVFPIHFHLFITNNP